jgi:site-specific DNA-cytosine methylase
LKTLATIGGGGGGFEAGAVEAGLVPVWTVECDSAVAAVHELNFKADVVLARAEDVDYRSLKSPYWLHMSPVCKNASVAKKDGKEEAEDVSMAEACARAIRECLAPRVSVENVWGYRNFESFRIILRALEELDYGFDYWHLNAANYGVPQTRKRLILLASKTHRPRRPAPTHAKNPSAQVDLFGSASLRRWVGWYEAIEDLIPGLPESKFAEWQLRRLGDYSPIGTFLQITGATSSHPETRGNGVKEVSEPSNTVTTWSLKDARAFIVDSFNSSHANITRLDGSPVFTVTSNNGNGRLNPVRAFILNGKNTRATTNEPFTLREASDPCFTVTATDASERHKAFVEGIPQTQATLIPQRDWLLHGRVVSMTPRALARFQSIPDSYALPDKAGLACLVVGNAVPSLLAKVLIESAATHTRRRSAEG